MFNFLIIGFFMIKSTFSFAVRKIKNRDVKLDASITNFYIFMLSLRYIFSFIRGVIKFRKIISVGSSVSILASENIRCKSGVTFGNNIIIDGLGGEGIQIGQGSSIGSFSLIKVSGTLTNLGRGIRIGSNVGVGDFSHIGGAGGVNIGDDTIIGAYFSVHPENHVFENAHTLIRQQGVTRQGIEVGNNCWIGAKVTLLDGCVIGSGCVVAAGAVVRGVFPNNVVIGGVPARILKKR